MSVQTQAATLLVLTSESSEAERIASVLRDAGVAAQATASARTEQLADLIKRTQCDLLVCCSHDREIDLDAVLGAYREIQSDVPLIVISAPDALASERIRARRAGARDLVAREDQEHLQHALAREFSDVIERRSARTLFERLHHCEELSRNFIDTTIDAVAYVQEGLHLYANAAYLQLFGYEEFEQLEIATLLELIDPESRTRAREYLREAEFSGQQATASLEIWCLDANKERFEASINAAPSEFDDEPCLRIVVRASDRQVVLGTSASPDAAPAPAIPESSGRAALFECMEQYLDPERMVSTPFALLFIHVPAGIELVQDLGLNAGLDLLDECFTALETLVGHEGCLKRVSDDSFALVVANIDQSRAEQIAGQIRTQVHLSQQLTQGDPPGEPEPDCDVSLMVLDGRAPEPTDLLNQIHQNCLRLRANTGKKTADGKKGLTSLASRSKQKPEDDDDVIVARIQRALEHDSFSLVYQPIISLMGDSQEHYTVLIRLDEADNILEAKDFIGPAIRRGLIEQIDKWAIRNAIRVIGEQRRDGRNISFFINLSEDTFRNPSIVLWICDCMREFDVRGSWLTFQFQEELVASNLTSLSKLVEALKKIKCRVAINRFGEAPRPQSLLQGLPVDFVLFMPHFAQKLSDDQKKQKQVIELANLAREFNVKSVVTGIEDARALTVLWTAGVDYVQGNFLQRPSPTLQVQTN